MAAGLNHDLQTCCRSRGSFVTRRTRKRFRVELNRVWVYNMRGGMHADAGPHLTALSAAIQVNGSVSETAKDVSKTPAAEGCTRSPTDGSSCPHVAAISASYSRTGCLGCYRRRCCLRCCSLPPPLPPPLLLLRRRRRHRCCTLTQPRLAHRENVPLFTTKNQ